MTCATCNGTGKTPRGMSFNGSNIAPLRIERGPCPVCADGQHCPWCYYAGGMDEDDNGMPKCRYCGWSATRDVAMRDRRSDEQSPALRGQRQERNRGVT